MTPEIDLNWKISTLALHAGDDEKYADSLNTPIFATSTFSFPDVETGRKRFSGEKQGYIYSRLGNPTVQASEKSLAILEGANLIKRGIDVEYMLKENEGHGFRNEENRFDFYRAMEKFLGKHLGGRVEAKTQD